MADPPSPPTERAVERPSEPFSPGFRPPYSLAKPCNGSCALNGAGWHDRARAARQGRT